ncbi:MAG: arginine repressor [Phycisphaerae bacterium]|nr:arginine repressor [Phycisphaerae bacterium]
MHGVEAAADRSARQAALLKLIEHRPFGTQDELVAALHRKGFEVTQASVSRDIRQLGLVKLQGRYVSPGPRSESAAQADGPLESELITGIASAGANLLIVRTRTGAASVVAAKLDEHKLPQIVGSLAGDDTIFLAVRSRAAQGQVVHFLRSWRPTP